MTNRKDYEEMRRRALVALYGQPPEKNLKELMEAAEDLTDSIEVDEKTQDERQTVIDQMKPKGEST